MSNEIIILCGASATGKDTIAEQLTKNFGYNLAVSHTTRPMREGEVEGINYHFIPKEVFLSMHEEFIEHRLYNTLIGGTPDTWYYGVHKSEISEDKKYVLIVDLQGLEQMLAYGKLNTRITSFYIHSNEQVRKQRALSRGGYDEQEWNRRVEDDRRVFANVEEVVDYCVDNECLLATIQQILSKADCKIFNK